jgi:hypothetical protein
MMPCATRSESTRKKGTCATVKARNASPAMRSTGVAFIAGVVGGCTRLPLVWYCWDTWGGWAAQDRARRTELTTGTAQVCCAST